MKIEEQLKFETKKRLDIEEMFQGINHVVKLLSTGESLKEILKELILYVESQVKGVRCSILLLDETGQYLHEGAAPNLPESYCHVLDGLVIGPTIGSCGAAAYKNEIVVVNDIETHPFWADFKELALSHNLRACWSLPIVDAENNVLGTLCPYFSEPKTPTDEEINTTQLIAYLAGIAIQLEGRNQALMESEARYESLFNHVKSIVTGTSTETGDKYLESLVANLASTLNMKFGFLGECQGSKIGVRFISVDNKPAGSFSYDMAGAPCEIVIKEKRPLLISQNVQEEFPDDHLLVDMEIESYFGVPICDPTGKVIANLVVMDNKPRMDTSTFELILSNFASRAEIELFRGKIEGKMLEAKELAEKSSRAKSEFLARMSHELRTPMNAIMGFTQLLKIDSKNKLNEQERDNLNRISSAANHLLELINEVLDLSKVESGKVRLTMESIDIIPIIDTVISISKPLADKLDVSLSYQEAPKESFFAELDPIRFKQIMLNLISNAIKYNKRDGSVMVSIKKQDNGNIRVGVKDTGVGIAENKREKLFRPFERLDVDPNKIEGTGIGLTISKQLIEMMEGTINFESIEGEGSFFYIDIPISEKLPLIKEEKKTESIPLSTSPNNKKKILYIEDNPDNVALVRRIFDYRQDIRLLSSSTAFAGIELAQSEKPDLILMDIRMPEMDGLTAFKILQSIEVTKSIPVVGLTADAMDENIKIALDMGFTGYITKPIDVSIFLEKIDEVFA